MKRIGRALLTAVVCIIITGIFAFATAATASAASERTAKNTGNSSIVLINSDKEDLYETVTESTIAAKIDGIIDAVQDAALKAHKALQNGDDRETVIAKATMSFPGDMVIETAEWVKGRTMDAMKLCVRLGGSKAVVFVVAGVGIIVICEGIEFAVAYLADNEKTQQSLADGVKTVEEWLAEEKAAIAEYIDQANLGERAEQTVERADSLCKKAKSSAAKKGRDLISKTINKATQITTSLRSSAEKVYTASSRKLEAFGKKRMNCCSP